MSSFIRPSQSDFLVEMQRLHAAQREAIQAGDEEAIEHAAHEMSQFLRMNAAGRMQEYFASRRQVGS